MLQNSALPCYSTNLGGGIGPLTHDDANPISPPRAFGPYRVMHQIGVGVLGPVFRTFEPDGDRLVALKAFHLDLTPEHARTLADLLHGTKQASGSHPALVPSIDAGVSDGIPYLATEYVAAESLDVAIRHYAPAPVDAAFPLIVQLADGLDAAHACGLTHGALHLRDVFLTPELARIAGFGVVPALEQVGVRGPLRRPYTAPEQMSSGEPGPAADRFALAAIVYELLTGRRASGHGEHMTEQLACVAGTRGAVRLARVFASALAVSPSERPASARLFADQLADAVGWPGAEAVREALAAMPLGASVDRTAAENPATDASVGDDVEEDTVEHGQNRDARPEVATVTEGEGAAMANTDRPEDASDASKLELDWSERSLDRGETEEVRQSAAYAPRPVGPPPGFQRPTERELTTPAGYPETDVDSDQALDQTLERTVGEALDAAAARPADGALDQLDEALDEGLGAQLSGRDGRPGADSLEAESWDLTLSTDIAGDDPGPLRLPHARGGSVSRGAGTVSAGLHASTPAPPVGYRGTQPPAAPIAGSPRGSTASDGPESYDDEDDDYQVVESAGRIRVGDDGLATASPGSQAAGAYKPIGLSVLAGRLGDDGDVADAQDEDDEDEFGDPGLVARGAANAAPAAVSLPLGGDENYDYDEGADDEAGEDDYDDDLSAAWPPTTRRLPVVPLVLLALAVVAGAFAIGFGWLSGGATESGATVDGSLAAGLDVSEVPAAPVMAEAATEQDYSEATISEAEPPPPLAVPAAEPPPDVPATRAPSAAPSGPSAPAPVANDGRLLIRSTPPGAQVAINGEPRGTTPLALSDLRYDGYDLTFTFGGYETQERRLIISAADPIAAVDARLTPVALPENQSVGVGSIFVDTRPPGVEVWLDQRLVGETPMLLPDVAEGSHVVEFKHDGYRDWSTTVQVDSATQARVAASLLPAR